MMLRDETNFSEAKHPRGQPENPGQFAPKGGGGGSKSQPNFRGSLARETSGNTTQPVKSLEELYERAKKAEPQFKSTIEGLAKSYGAEAKFTPPEFSEPGTSLKSLASATRKLASELGGDPTLLRDVMRATLVSDNVETTRKMAAQFIADNEDSILRVKDRYSDPLKGGYRDILINYRTPDGLVAEVQFNSKNMLRVKNEEAHKIYAELRDLKEPIKAAIVLKLERSMLALYHAAYIADGDGEWREKTAHDAEKEIMRIYKLVSPDGHEFIAAIVGDPDNLTVVSNRSGSWGADKDLTIADLIMPEQRLSEWDVTQIKGDTPKSTGDKRIIDRSTDIEYYTAESLGPTRERTPEGFLICYDVPVARTGEMTYGPGEVPDELGVGRDGRIKVTRAPSEVFSSKSMASLNGKPVTDDHPPVDVDPQNWRYYTRGVVVNPRRGEGEFKDCLIADMIVFDAETIRDIELGKREVSCGYNPDYLQVLGRDGEPVPGVGEQANIIYNHLALVDRGRCGAKCAIRDNKTVDNAATNFWSRRTQRRLNRLARRA